MNNVIEMPAKTRRTSRKATVVSKAPVSRRKVTRQLIAANFLGTVGVVLTGLSLSHLAQGIELVTHSPTWESWSMAIGVDMGFIAIELAQIFAMSEAVRRSIRKFTTPAIIGTLVASAIMNAFAFANLADGNMVYPAVAFGVAIPGMIYAIVRVWATLVLSAQGLTDRRSRA